MAENNKSTAGGQAAAGSQSASSGQGERKLVLLQSSPHIVSPVNSRSLMCNVLIALAPATVYGVVIFGLPALINVVVSVAAAMAAETVFRLATKQPVRTGDLSAAVTGVLLALVIPPGMPLWMTALGAIFAIVVAKEFFGGLGANVFNPALIGRAFLLMSFPAAMTTWAHSKKAIFDAVSAATDVTSGATPLGIIHSGNDIAAVGRNLAEQHLAASSSYGDTLWTLFIGNHGGCTGETSTLLILAGGIFLLVTKTIDWRAPLAMLLGAALGALILGLDPLFSLLSGGLMFGAVFMITDYVSSPVTATGKLIFGFGAGIITMLIRRFGVYPEGTSYGILIMNAAVPFLNKFLQKKYGFVAKKGAA